MVAAALKPVGAFSVGFSARFLIEWDDLPVNSDRSTFRPKARVANFYSTPNENSAT